MKKDLLQAVISVEKEIQHSIETERKKAAEWLESVRVSLGLELEEKKRQLAEEYTNSLEKTCATCRLEAEKEITDVTRMAEHLEKLSDTILQEVVTEYLNVILPEACR